jgi:hypothetical protein
MIFKKGDKVKTKIHKGLVKALWERSGVVTEINSKEPFPVKVKFTQPVHHRNYDLIGGWFKEDMLTLQKDE